MRVQRHDPVKSVKMFRHTVIIVSLLIVFVSCRTSINLDLQQWINHTRMKEIIMNDITDNQTNLDDKALQVYLKMFDASTKIPSGFIFGGTFYDLGNFDECFNIQEIVSNNTEIYGKYCLGRIPIPQTSPSNVLKSRKRIQDRPRVHPEPRGLIILGEEYMGWYVSICVPSAIPADKIVNINGVPQFNEAFCSSKDHMPPLSTGAILTITTLAIFFTISGTSTLYDIYLVYTNQKAPHEMLIAFSYLSNGKKLIKSNNHPDHLLCLNGIRAISMMWVILGHVFSTAMGAPLSNLLYAIDDWENDAANMVILGATVSVDTFFTVGGLVTVYTFLNAMEKGQKFNIFMYYLHRFLRLTPAYGIAMLVYYNLTEYLGTGPLWSTAIFQLSESCRRTWWNSILYFANYIQYGFVSIIASRAGLPPETSNEIP